MAMIANDFKEFLTIEIKPRDDNVFDQYSRIFMVKVLLICSMVTGLSWYGDKFNCMLPEGMMISEDFPGFVGSTCWIQGVYVYRELSKRSDKVAYYGITKDIDEDGTFEGKLCKTIKSIDHTRNEHCVPMQKTFFQQYQYMPFLIGAIALMYYIPYMFHKLANHDIVRLKRQVLEREEPDPSLIYRVFFKQHKGRTVSQSSINYRQLMILTVKIVYIIVNVVALLLFNSVLNGNFISFGTKWFDWVSLNNTEQFDYMGSTVHPKPANEILPPFGYCEIYSGAKDIKEAHINKHKVVCELSQHVLYQYTLVLLWLLIIVGIVIAIIGFIAAIFKMITGYIGIRALGNHPQTRKIYRRLTPREMDYFEFLKEQNINLYGEILALFTEDIANESRSNASTPPQMNDWDKTSLMNGGGSGRNSKDMELTQRPGYEL